VVVDEWNNWSPIWSPDGQEIAFLSSRGNKRGIWRIPAFGGTPTPIAFLEIPVTDLKYWSKDGETIYLKTDENLYSIDIVTNAIKQITDFDPSGLTHRHFSISPREDQIAYVDVVGSQRNLRVMPLSGGNPIQITNGVEEDRYPVWHPDGRRLIYSSLRDGVFQLCVAYIDAHKPMRITTGESDTFVSDVSADGTKILYSSSREESDIWAINTETGEEYQITSDAGAELWSDISHDGKRIAFQSIAQLSQSGNLSKSRLLVKPLDTDKGQIRLATEAQEPRWSPDNQKIAFMRAAGFGATLWSVSAAGGDEKQLSGRSISGFRNFTLPYNRFTAGDFSWSPDSNRICFCSEEPEPGLWLCDIRGGSDVKITGSEGAGTELSSPLWSRDGMRIAYESTVPGEKITRSVIVWDAKAGKSKTVYQTDSVMRLLGWSPEGELYLAAVEGKAAAWASPAEVTLIRIPTEQGTALPIARTASTYLYTLTLSPDGRLIVFVSRQEGKANIWAFSTRDGKIKKLMANNDPKLYFSSISWSPDSKTIYFDKQSRFSSISLITNFK
jgi:Tol biopolymer transport system component